VTIDAQRLGLCFVLMCLGALMQRLPLRTSPWDWSTANVVVAASLSE
jgi:hypothetical protein